MEARYGIEPVNWRFWRREEYAKLSHPANRRLPRPGHYGKAAVVHIEIPTRRHRGNIFPLLYQWPSNVELNTRHGPLQAPRFFSGHKTQVARGRPLSTGKSTLPYPMSSLSPNLTPISPLGQRTFSHTEVKASWSEIKSNQAGLQAQAMLPTSRAFRIQFL